MLRVPQLNVAGIRARGRERERAPTVAAARSTLITRHNAQALCVIKDKRSVRERERAKKKERTRLLDIRIATQATVQGVAKQAPTSSHRATAISNIYDIAVSLSTVVRTFSVIEVSRKKRK